MPDDDVTATLSLDIDTEEENRLVNAIRERVRVWRNDGYPGAESVTRKLLVHWADDASHRQLRPFFAQREAIETLIWLREVAQRGTPERRDLEKASREATQVRCSSRSATSNVTGARPPCPDPEPCGLCWLGWTGRIDDSGT